MLNFKNVEKMSKLFTECQNYSEFLPKLDKNLIEMVKNNDGILFQFW